MMGSLSTKEIKLDSKEIESGLDKVSTSIEALNPTFSKIIVGDNKLKFVDDLNECKEKIDDLLTRYQTLLLRNVELTREAVDDLVETDQSIAREIKKLNEN